MDIIQPTREKNDGAALLAEFLNGLPVAICRTDADGTILFCNRRCARILRAKSPDVPVGTHAGGLLADSSAWPALVSRLAAGEEIGEQSLSLQTGAGDEVACWMSAGAVFDEAGNIVYIDICLEKASARVADRPSSLPDGLIRDRGREEALVRLDIRGNIWGASRKMQDMLGYSLQDLMGRHLHEFVPPGEKMPLREFLHEIASQSESEKNILIRSADGNIHRLRFIGKQVAGAGDRREIFASAVDVSGHDDARAAEMEKLRFQGVMEMSRAVSQQLAQPLTVINLLMDQLEASPDKDPRQYMKLVKIRHQIDQLNELEEKIRRIKKYQSMEYVAGIKITDLDNSG